MKITVRVVPNSKTEEVFRKGDEYVIRVNEPAKEGKANKVVIKLLAEHFKVPRGSVDIVSGIKSRNKIVEISGI